MDPTQYCALASPCLAAERHESKACPHRSENMVFSTIEKHVAALLSSFCVHDTEAIAKAITINTLLLFDLLSIALLLLLSYDRFAGLSTSSFVSTLRASCCSVISPSSCLGKRFCLYRALHFYQQPLNFLVAQSLAICCAWAIC